MQHTAASSRVSKRKDPAARFRVTRACDYCKAKKARCSGTQPCLICTAKGFECEYNAVYRRGKAKENVMVPGVSWVDEGHAASGSADVDDDDAAPGQLRQMPVSSSRNSEVRDLGEEDGPYVGPSSGQSFLLRAQRRLRETLRTGKEKPGPIFAFGDAPLPQIDTHFLDIPPRDEADVLLKAYFDLAFPTHRFLHRPTVEAWLNDFYCHRNRIDPPPGTRERHAAVLMVMAQARLYVRSRSGEEDDALRSTAYYAASESLLSQETGEPRLTSVQVRLAQCFYLLTRSRINHCWNSFGTTIRLALALGLHRSRDVGTTRNLIAAECRKRVFWCAYSLDNYLSAALGRPRAFHDEDIDQSFPDSIDDGNLFSDHIVEASSKSQTVMHASICHAKLSRIISSILRDQYGIKRLSVEEQATLCKRHCSQLRSWRGELGDFLDVQRANIALLMPPFSRQCTVLNLAHSYAVILACRLVLLSNAADTQSRLQGQAPVPRGRADTVRQCVREMLQAADKIVETVTEICESREMYGAYWFTQYYAFCALVVQYVSVTQRQADEARDWKARLQRAERCQSLLANSVPADSFLRYKIVLEELRQAAVGVLAKRNQRQANVSASDPRTLESSATEKNGNVVSSIGAEPTAWPISLTEDDNASTSLLTVDSAWPLLDETTGWSDFDSLVNTGIGLESDFDAFLMSDPGPPSMLP